MHAPTGHSRRGLVSQHSVSCHPLLTQEGNAEDRQELGTSLFTVEIQSSDTLCPRSVSRMSNAHTGNFVT